jgi:hypothetical protein
MERQTNMTVSEHQLKELVKTAIVKVPGGGGDLIRDIVEDALEDVGMTKAIREGEDRHLVCSDQVFELFEDRP